MVTQNSHQELLAIFGTSAPDTVAPTVHIKSPANGAEFKEGAEFVIEAIANDDRAVVQLELFNGDMSIQAKTEEPYTWDVFDIPEGYYEFRVVATDKGGNVAESDIVEVIVGDPVIPEEDDGDDDEDGSGTDAGPGQDEDGGGKGCGCGSTQAPAHWAFALFGLAVALRRRRRA
jgi:MYXO-CTERM domain-containing protein